MAYDVLDPFMTFARHHRDWDRVASVAENRALDERQWMIESWLLGEVPAEAVLETLLDQGISPDDYICTVEANIDYVIDQGVRFASNESGLFLPSPLLEGR